MKRLLFAVGLVGALSVALFTAWGQNPPAQTPRASADPYLNNAAPGTQAYPLAAPAGKDGGSYQKELPGAVNQGPFNMNTWKYGHAFDAPANSKIWNPVKLKMMRGEKVTGGTVFSGTDPETYCAMANAGYDFIWTEMQHSPRDWEAVGRMWAACPHAKAVPGVRVAYADEREIQHATDLGALVVVIPTVRSVEEGIAGRNWTFFPPLGKRSTGGGQGTSSEFWGDVPGGYRATANDNIVLIEMIETLDGIQNAREIASIPGVTAIFAASVDLGNFSGYARGTPDYERLINAVHDAAIGAGKRLCGPFTFANRPDFTCFQNGSEISAITKGVAAELGPLKDKQAVPEVGPYAPKK